MKGHLNIAQLTATIVKRCEKCCARRAWDLVNYNPQIIQRVKRGRRRVWFEQSQVAALCNAINNGTSNLVPQPKRKAKR